MTQGWIRRGCGLAAACAIGLTAHMAVAQDVTETPDTNLEVPAPQEVAPQDTTTTIDPKTMTRVEELLGGIEYVPKPQEWIGLGVGTEDALQHIASDNTRLKSRRGRAISALGHFSSAKTHTFLQSVVADQASPSLLRRKAVQAMANSMRADALPFLQPYVSNSDKRLRESAIRAVAKMKTPEARTVLQERLKIEQAPYLKDIIQTSLKKP